MMDKSITILLVEDDEVDAMNVKRAFRKLKITNPLFVAENGLEALAMLRGDGAEKIIPRPKIILLDINMPRMNGIEFLQELRADPELKSISVVMLTTSNEERDKIAAYDLNVAGYILKPVVPDKFIEAISALNIYWALIELPETA
jgi:CheY-like chemotaxis protein